MAGLAAPAPAAQQAGSNAAAPRDFFQPGRSPVSGLSCAVTSSHALASTAALNVLHDGGNAMDAAVTASFVLCVVEPQSTGLGGDCFALVHPAGLSEPIGFNGSGRTPAGLDARRARLEGGAPLDETSVHAVTIPGLVDGLARLLDRFGSWPLQRVLEPAIAYARDGFVVHQRTAEEWAFAAPKLARMSGARALLLRQRRAPRAGEVIRLPAVAATLERLAGEGAQAFYRSDMAETMARFLADKGGFHTRQDFAAHQGQEVTPISVDWQGHDIWQIPPNGQGATALMMLQLLRGERWDDFDGADRHRRLAEIAHAAFSQRDRLIGDPDFGPVHLNVFLERQHALQSLALEEPAVAAGPAARGDTAYVGVVDRQRNVVSLISSLFEGFGTGLCEPRTGIVFHNRGSGFSARTGHPNELAAGKRPLHTIIPGLVTRGGRPVLCFGVTGGAYQPIGHVQLITGMLDHGLDIQGVIDRPRSFLIDGRLQLEPALMRHRARLAAAGHDVVAAPRAIGGAHGLVIDWERASVTGGSDPRKDGCALAM